VIDGRVLLLAAKEDREERKEVSCQTGGDMQDSGSMGEVRTERVAVTSINLGSAIDRRLIDLTSLHFP
jgi:hypothetical protein